MRAVPFFRGLPGDDVRALAASLLGEDHLAGSVVFHAGDAAEAMYLVDTGLVEVRSNGEPLAVLGPGSFVGELGLLLGEPRSADLVAVADTRLFALRRSAVDRLLEQHPALSLELSRELGRRLVATSRRAVAAPPPRVIAFWGDPSDADRFVRAVDHVCGRDVVVVAAGEAMPGTVAGDATVVALLPAERTRESRRALRAAAHVVCTEAPPTWVLRRHPAAQVLRVGRAMPMDRAARWATGRAVGLVLSSGGSKTVAHLGVTHELERQGVRLDALAGSSGGSVIAAAVAAGIGHEKRMTYLREVADLLGVRRWDFNLPPRTGLMKGRRLRDAVDRMLDGRTFADLDVPLYLVATDVGTGDEVVLDSGPLADAIRASLGIPGAFDPWRVGRRLLIDGAVVNPMPASVLRDRGISIVIASMVAGKRDDPGGPPLTSPPPVMQTILRMVNLMERELIQGQLPLVDVLIRPEVATSYSFDFSSMDEHVEEGRRAAAAALTVAPASVGTRRAVGLP